MNVSQYDEHLIKLTRLGAINCYLVREADGFTLIDTGMSGSENGILKAAAEFNTPIRRVLLTHAHVDHAGSLDALAQHLPDAQFLFSQRTEAFLHGDMSLHPDEPDAKLRGGFPTCTTHASQYLTPGDQIGSLEVIASPGHSPDHMAFFDRRDRTLLAGDAFQTKGGVAVAGVIRWLFPLPALATWHLPTALKSAQLLVRFEPRRLAVGHGRIIDEPILDMEQAIREAEKKVEGQ